MADGDIVFSISADDAEAQKKLAQLRRDIEKTEKSLADTRVKRDGITQQLEQAKEAARQEKAAAAERTRQEKVAGIA